MIIGVILLHAYVEHKISAWNVFVFKDIINLCLIASIITLYGIRKLTRNEVLIVMWYSLILNVISSFFIRVNAPDFNFENYFLKSEIIIIILTLSIGILVRPIHMLIIMAINLLFIALCFFVYDINYPTEKFLLYIVMVLGTGILGYKVYMLYDQLSGELENANGQLSAINKSKDRLFQIIGHDLRTPFNQISGLLTLTDMSNDPKERQELKKKIEAVAQKGNVVLTDLLNWAYSISDEYGVKNETVLLEDVVDRACNFLELTIQSKNINLVNSVTPDVKLCTDAIMLETVVRNLLSNAIKFSPRDSEVLIQTKSNKETITLSIIDHGIGMSQCNLDRLLAEDKNDSLSGTENEKGTGFGFGICKNLVAKLNGTVNVKSTLNKGTTVDISFPLKSTS